MNATSAVTPAAADPLRAVVPGTLLDLAGASRAPSAWSAAVLVLIDHQREYLDGKLPLVGIGPAAEHCAALLALARAHGTPVIHVVHHGRPGGGLFDPQGQHAGLISGLEPLPGEHQVIKGLPNSFAGTNLAQLLAETGRKELIVAGFQTHMCVSATVRSALDHGYRSTVVANACATRDLPDPLGGPAVPAEQLHRISLAALHDRFATVVADSAAWG